MQFNDQAITEETLFALYKSQGYEDTAIALKLALEKITAKIATLSDTVTRKQLEATKKLIEDEIQASYGGLFAQMQAESVAVAMAVNAPYLLEFATAKIPTETMDYLVNGKRDIMGYGFEELFKLTADNHARALRVTLASGVAQGMHPSKIIKEMNIKNDSLTNHQLYTNVFTTIKDAREVTTYATYKQLEDLGVVKGYKFNATMDNRTSEQCRNLDNVKWMTTIDKIPSRPPLHFLCRSKLLPITTNEYKTGKRASMDGEIDDMSYGEWFTTKDDKFQLMALGRTKFDAYKKGIYSVNGISYLKPKNSLSLDSISDELNIKSIQEKSIEIINNASSSPLLIHSKLSLKDSIQEFADSIGLNKDGKTWAYKNKVPTNLQSKFDEFDRQWLLKKSSENKIINPSKIRLELEQLLKDFNIDYKINESSRSLSDYIIIGDNKIRISDHENSGAGAMYGGNLANINTSYHKSADEELQKALKYILSLVK